MGTILGFILAIFIFLILAGIFTSVSKTVERIIDRDE